MAASMASRSLLFKEVLSTPFGVNVLLKSFSAYSPQSVKSFGEIPGPKSRPIVGNVWKYYKGEYPLDILPLLYESYLGKYGPLVKEHMFYGRTLVHVFDPLDMKRIYSLDQNYYYPQRVSHRALEEYRKMRKYKNGGLACSNGETWAELRLSLGDDLFKEHHKEAINLVAKDFVNKICFLTLFSPDRHVNLFPWLYYWAFECMASVVLGVSFWVFKEEMKYRRIDNFIQDLHDSQEAVFYTENLPRFLTRKWQKKLVDSQDQIYHFLKEPMTYSVWKLYKSYPIPKSVTVEGTTICLKNSMAHALVERDVDDRDIRTFILDFFQGGIHSPAHVLAFALQYLAENPDEQKKVRKAIVDKTKNMGDIEKHTYSREPVCKEVENVILETMRLRPPTIGTGRLLPAPLILSGYNVPRNTLCILHHQIASKQEEHFESPGHFLPDRFNKPLSPAAEVANSPFSMGDRACPMKEMAMSELCITLTAILSNFELLSDYEKVGIKSGLTNEPNRNMKIWFRNSRI